MEVVSLRDWIHFLRKENDASAAAMLPNPQDWFANFRDKCIKILRLYIFLLTNEDALDPDFLKLGNRFLRMTLQIFGASTDFLKWAEEITSIANSRVVYHFLC